MGNYEITAARSLTRGCITRCLSFKQTVSYSRKGVVKFSSSVNHRIANTRSSPHISSEACKPEQQAGRSGRPKIAQRKSSVSWMQGTPAGLPLGIPGMELEIDGAMQQAAHRGRH
jgi:hypothetical protein